MLNSMRIQPLSHPPVLLRVKVLIHVSSKKMGVLCSVPRVVGDRISKGNLPPY